MAGVLFDGGFEMVLSCFLCVCVCFKIWHLIGITFYKNFSNFNYIVLYSVRDRIVLGIALFLNSFLN